MDTHIIRSYGKEYSIIDLLSDILSKNNTHLVLFCPQEHIPVTEPDTQLFSKTELFAQLTAARNHMDAHQVHLTIVVGRSKYPEHPTATFSDFCMIYWNEIFDVIAHEVMYLSDWWLKDGARRHYVNRHTKFTFPLPGGQLDHICTMRSQRAHAHRCVMMDHLAKYNLLHDGFSWRMLSNQTGDAYPFRYWKEELLDPGEYPLDSDLAPEYWDTFNTQHPGEMNSLVEVVAESTVNTVFWTEKTAKWLLYGKPFIIIGAPEINVRLRDLGFELYDELFSYRFDTEFDLDVRAGRIAQQLHGLHLDFPTPESRQPLWNQVQPKLQRNHDRLIELMTTDYPDPITSWLEHEHLALQHLVNGFIKPNSR